MKEQAIVAVFSMWDDDGKSFSNYKEPKSLLCSKPFLETDGKEASPNSNGEDDANKGDDGWSPFAGDNFIDGFESSFPKGLNRSPCAQE
jgi:hypothetical protein